MTQLYHSLTHDPRIWHPTSDGCSTMLLATLLTMGRKWKIPECLSTHEWIVKLWLTYKMQYYSVVKKNEILR